MPIGFSVRRERGCSIASYLGYYATVHAALFENGLNGLSAFDGNHRSTRYTQAQCPQQSNASIPNDCIMRRDCTSLAWHIVCLEDIGRLKASSRVQTFQLRAQARPVVVATVPHWDCFVVPKRRLVVWQLLFIDIVQTSFSLKRVAGSAETQGPAASGGGMHSSELPCWASEGRSLSDDTSTAQQRPLFLSFVETEICRG